MTESKTPSTSVSTSAPRLTDDELVTAFREAPVAQRTDAQIDAAAARFVKATQERAVRMHARKRRMSKLRIVLPIVGAVVLVGVGIAVGRIASANRTTDARDDDAVNLQPAPGAVFERVEHGPVRAARLHEGSVVVSVAKSERMAATPYRVVTGDGEVLVGGGLVEVSARADRTGIVRVLEGSATVRSVNGASHAMNAGDIYEAPPASPDPTGRTEARARMNNALALLASGDYREAADAFTAEAESPGAPFVEEATFWQAIALSRAGNGTEAKAKLEAFLARFPSSSHRLEALGVLGWELLQANDREGARRAFEDAKQSDDRRVRESAEAGLTRLRP